MKSSRVGALLFFLGIGLLGWAVYDYVAHPTIDAENCGVTVAPVDPSVAMPAFTAANRVPLKLINRSGRPIRIVGNNAC